MNSYPVESAVSAFKRFMLEMRTWETKYAALVDETLTDAKQSQLVKNELIEAKGVVLKRWCLPSAIDSDSLSAFVQDPPAFDPDRDEVIAVESSEHAITVEHLQRAGLRQKSRFQLVSDSGTWKIAHAERERAPNVWVKLII